MAHFKPGDRVICVDNSHHSKMLALGDMGTVADPPYDDGYLMVKADRDKEPRGWITSRWQVKNYCDLEDTRAYLEAITS